MSFEIKPDVDIRCRDFTIGAIGSGFIMGDVQLAAYDKAGFRVKGVSSRDQASSKKVVDRWGLEKVYSSVAELLDDEDIDIVDVAIPPHAQIDIIREAVKRPHIKGILVQKPIAMDYKTACEIVELCRTSGKVLSVNQNMRFDQSMQVANQLIQSGKLGEVVAASIDMRAVPHWQTYLEDYDRLTLLNMSIHHIDVMRFLLGEAEEIFVMGRKDPALSFDHKDGICSYLIRFESGAMVTIIDDAYSFPREESFPGDSYINWRIEGTSGVAKGTFGWPDYPDGSPSTCQYACEETNGEWVKPVWDTMWFPDAFVGVMEQLQYALKTNTKPFLSGEDNLKTMALVEAGYVSMNTGAAVSPQEIEK